MEQQRLEAEQRQAQLEQQIRENHQMQQHMQQQMQQQQQVMSYLMKQGLMNSPPGVFLFLISPSRG